MTLLLLGGTSDAKYLAHELHISNIPLVYSLAGKVEKTHRHYNYPVIIGGFSQSGGLANFIRQQNITAVLDATHPYATQITEQAFITAQNMNIPYWRYERPAWLAQEGDRWTSFKDETALFEQFIDKKHILFTQGHLSTGFLQQLIHKRQTQQTFYLRTMVKPKHDLPAWMPWIQAPRAFSLEQELHLIQQYHIDALVTKNSGGEFTYAKLLAARQLEVPVFLLQRPMPTKGITGYSNYVDCLKVVRSFYQTNT